MEKYKGLLATIITWITGTVLPSLDSTAKDEVIFWLQSAAFVVTILVGIATLRRSKRKSR